MKALPESVMKCNVSDAIYMVSLVRNGLTLLSRRMVVRTVVVQCVV